MKKTNSPVNCNNDDEMIALGIRAPHLVGRDQSVWTKTDKEKEEIKRRKSSSSSIGKGCSTGKPFSPIYGNLIIRTKGCEAFKCFNKTLEKMVPKTTFSLFCNQSDISTYLRYFSIAEVINYSWNGKTYSTNELPFAYGRKRNRK